MPSMARDRRPDEQSLRRSEMQEDVQGIELARAFTALRGVSKALVLAHLTHEQTIHARASYVRGSVDVSALKRSNELIHRLAGYTMQVLLGETKPEQDASFLAMILDVGYSADQLRRWIRCGSR
jgi:hypothetical protein